jgi:hypothetical protein
MEMEIVRSVLSVAAIIVSIIAYRHASKAFRLGQRPLVRVVGVVETQVGMLGPGTSNSISPEVLDLGEVILKNVGRGHALSVVAFDPHRAALLGEVPVVEPLGAGDDEASRIGRVRLALQGRMTMSSEYALYYQDTLGGWHLTKFFPKPGKIACAYVGEVKKVPSEVEPLGTVLKA